MRIDFIDNNTVVASTDKLIDIDLSYYDNVLVSKPVAPEVRFTIAYNHLDNNDPFVTWWKAITVGEIPENVFAVIYDGQGYEVASGDLFEYDEDLQNFSLEILIVPGIIQSLGVNTDKSDLKGYDIYKTSSIAYISQILRQHFIRIWDKYNIPFSVQLAEQVQGTYPDFIHMASALEYAVQSQINTNDKHYIRFDSSFNGTKLSFIESLSLTYGINFLWSRKFNMFYSRSYATPVQAFGFIKNTTYSELTETSFDKVIKSIKIADIGGGTTDITNIFYNKVNIRLNNLIVRKNYNIKGRVAFKWLYPGDSIHLNGQTFIIKEINYDPVSLNIISHMGSNLNLKSFHAVCVKAD